MSDNKKPVRWTPSQENAIKESGKQLLVAAGAGSGKTSVLTERILKKILEGADVTDFLVTTFTVESAQDMKEKLRRKLSKALASEPENKHLSNQIAKLPFAQISTISAFCLKLVKQNFSALSLPSSVRIADAGEEKELFEEALDLLLDDKFSKKDEDFYTVLEKTACRGNDFSLSQYLTEIYDKLRAHPRYIEKAKALSERFSEDAENCNTIDDLWNTNAGKLITDASECICNDFQYEISALAQLTDSIGDVLKEQTDKYINFLKSGIHNAKNKKFLESAEAFSNADSFYSDGWRGKPLKLLEPEERQIFDQLRGSLRAKAKKASEFFCSLENDSVSQLKLCAEAGKALTSLVCDLDVIYSNLKREKGVIDFKDAEQLAHRLLINEDGTPTALCKEISASTSEVLVDEYQDTNPLQDSIFGAIASKDNRFMVGDDKQSIYRFRNAYPDIFNSYKKSFRTEKASCIFLRENFRCSKEIIDFTNDIFNYLWGKEYTDECLIFQKDEEAPKREVTVKTFFTNLKNKHSSVIEARYIGEEIKKLMNSFVKNNGKPLEYSDIAIMLPVTKTIGDIFSEELRKMGIPSTSKKKGFLTEAPEIKLMISILKAINNPEEDVPLASAMNSFFFGFSTDELARIRSYKDSSLWGGVVRCCGKKSSFMHLKLVSKKKVKKAPSIKLHFPKSTDLSLRNKCKSFVSRMEELRYKGRSLECKQLIWELYENEGILSYVENLPEGEIKKGNLLLLYSDAIAFGKREFKTLSAFLKHTEKLDIQTYSPESSSAVSIMTIHGSKGLEFPVCFLANAGKSLSESHTGAKMPMVDMNTGIFTPLKENDVNTYEPIFYKSLEILEKPAELAENKRKLYVALTRAREKLYIVGSADDKYQLRNSSPDDASSYLSWILTVNPDAEYLDEIPDESQLDTEYEEILSVEEADESFEEEETARYFPSKLPRKLSVSELKEKSMGEYVQTVKKSDFLTVPPFITQSKQISGAEIGTANHTFMQFASFENCIKFGVEYEGERLLLTDMITSEQYGMLNFKNLKAFFTSPLFERISKSNKVYREKRFTIADNSKELFGNGNETVLIQGVIDLFFENEDGTYTVVDYKTDRIKHGEEQILCDRYKSQIAYYAKAVSDMTGKEIKECILYSFHLSKSITVDFGTDKQ